jgi:hypothetical protein
MRPNPLFAVVVVLCLIASGPASADVMRPPGIGGVFADAPGMLSPQLSSRRLTSGAPGSAAVGESVGPMPPVSPSQLCRQAIARAERRYGIPARFLDAIGKVESGRRDPQTKEIVPWPWTIDAEGEGHVYDSKADAITAVRTRQAQGMRSIDVGCLQVNLMHHPDAFPSLEAAFDPVLNVDYGARLLQHLYQQTSSWPQAAALYHSATPELGADYRRKVLATWSDDQGGGAGGVGLTTPRAAPIIGPGPVMLSNHAERARIIPLATVGGIATPGRGLDAYRAMPISLSSRMPVAH